MAQYRIVSPYQNGVIVVCLYLITDTIDFNKHVHDIDFFINDKWRKYAGDDIGQLFKITR
jgi:hypothetical protein